MNKKALIISCFNWYDKRIKPIRTLLQTKQYEVTVLIADFEHISKKPVYPRYDECTYVHVPKYKSNMSTARIISHLCFAKQCKKIIDKQKPDLIFCQVPPNKVVNYCSDYKKKNPKSKFIIDIIDLWPESMPLGKLRDTPLAKIWQSWRNDAIKIADHVFTECELYQEILKDIIDQSKTTTLYLYKEQKANEEKLVNEIIEKKKPDGLIRFAYLGSMNNIIDIEGICTVVKQFIENGRICEFHAIGDGSSKDFFEQSIKATGCRTYFYGAIFDELEKIRILSPCDFAFNMMKRDISVGLTIKSIDYLSFGLPLINNIKGDTMKMIEENGLGVNVREKADIVNDYNHRRIKEYFDHYFTKNAFIICVETVINALVSCEE